MDSMRHSLTLLVAFSISLSTSVAHPRHDDRSHKHKHAQRQGAFAGIQMVSSSGGPNPIVLPSSDGTVAASVITSYHISTPTADLSGNPADQLAANSTTRTFPIAVLQIPVATVCPPNASIPLPISSYPLINNTNFLNRTNAGGPILNTTIPLTNATGYVPTSTQASSPSPTATLADANARIILDSNGCQTLFSPVTTAICSTVVSVGGQVPVNVTDCGQWMTFSSSPVCGAAPAATALPNGTAGETMAYFLAPWFDIASGVVPAKVQVQTCSNFAIGWSGGGSCVTRSESWSVSTTTALSTVVQTARFFGGAVGPLNLTLIPNHLTTSIPSTNGTTTSLSIDTTLTHLSPHAVPTIVRSRLDPDHDSSDQNAIASSSITENTIITTVQLPTVTQTYHLESAIPPPPQEQQQQQHTTVTATATLTTTVTVTVQMTLTSLVPLPLSTALTVSG